MSDQNISCLKVHSKLVLIDTRSLYLDFMTVEYPDDAQNEICKENEISDPDIEKRFADSEEITEYLPMMFPIAEDQFYCRPMASVW